MINRKSQAALEFIMTYGWAILVVLVAIGALAYFGVLSPDRFLPSKCTMQPGIACNDFKITPTSLTVYLQNSLGRDISIDCVKAQLCNGIGDCSTGNVQASLPNGITTTLTLCCGINCVPAIPTNVMPTNKYNGNINITYTITDTNIQHVNQGQVTGKIE